jgi:hypothetical protein
MGDAYRTFYNAAQKVYWLKDFLMHDIPNVRIMAFGYDVAVWHPWNQVSQGWLSGYAADLLGSLSGCRNDERKYVSGPFLKMKWQVSSLTIT